MRADAAAAWCPFVADGVHVLPVLHERLEYADLVRVAVDQIQPQAIAFEIPSSLGRAWLQAVDRLPAISVLLYENSLDQTIYLPVHPADPLVEAARMAREMGKPVREAQAIKLLKVGGIDPLYSGAVKTN